MSRLLMASTSRARGLTLRLFGEHPITEMFEPVITDSLDQVGHRIGPDVATVSHDRGQRLTDVIGARVLCRRHERMAEMEFVVDLD